MAAINHEDAPEFKAGLRHTDQMLALLAAGGVTITYNWLIDLARKGFFPVPDRGWWKPIPVLVGLTSYYQNKNRDTAETHLGLKDQNIQEDIELKRIKKDKLLRRLIATENVARCWSFISASVAARIRVSEMPSRLKEDLLKSCSEISLDEYFRTTTAGEIAEGSGASGAGTVPIPAAATPLAVG